MKPSVLMEIKCSNDCLDQCLDAIKAQSDHCVKNLQIMSNRERATIHLLMSVNRTTALEEQLQSRVNQVQRAWSCANKFLGVCSMYKARQASEYWRFDAGNSSSTSRSLHWRVGVIPCRPMCGESSQ